MPEPQPPTILCNVKTHAAMPPNKLGADPASVIQADGTSDAAKVDSSTVVTPVLGLRAQLLCACGHGLTTAGPLLAIMAYAPKVYITNFHAPPALLGLLMIIVQVYDILNIHPVAKWSDAGRANGWLFNADLWGRRAPFAVIGYPLLVVGIFLVWVGPLAVGFSGMVVALWFFAMRFLLSTGSTMYLMAATTAMYELFPSKRERNALATYLSGFQLVGAVFGLILVGSFVLSVTPGSTKEFMIFFVVGVFSVVLTWSILPHISVMRATCFVEPVKGASLIELVKVVSRSQSARTLVFARFLCFGVIAIQVTFMPFYLQYACDVSVENLGLANSAVLATNMLTRLLCLPLFNWLVRRFCPARLVTVSMITAAITAAPVALATYLTKQWPFYIIAAFILAINGGIADICLRVLLGFVTDEDQVVRTMEGRDSSDDPCFIAPRRDGLFWSVWTLAEALAGLYVGVGTVIFGMAGLDGKLDDEGKSQPASAVLAITIFFLGVVLFNYILAAFVMNRFSLRGERLAELQGRYEQLFRDVEKKTSVRRSALKMGDSEVATGSGSISS